MCVQNKIGMSALISHPDKKTIEEQIEIFSSVGFESFFLSSGVTSEFEKIPMWSKFAKCRGIEFEAVHAPSNGVDFVWDSLEKGAVYKKSIEKIIDYCSVGEISKIVIHVGTDSKKQVTLAGLEFWKNLEVYAEKRGVIICYENANTPLLFEEVVKNSACFHGVCHDVGHQMCYTPDKNYLEMFANKLIYTHIHDNFGKSEDLHFLPGDGQNNWEKYFDFLLNIGYAGTFNLELSCYHSAEYRLIPFEEFVKLSYDRIISFVGQ